MVCITLQALQVSLGVTARKTGRGGSLTEFIRTGASEARIMVSGIIRGCGLAYIYVYIPYVPEYSGMIIQSNGLEL